MRGYILAVVLAAAIAAILFKVIFNLGIVNGSSMSPTLNDGDVLLLDRLLYEPEYNDIVVFKNEERDSGETNHWNAGRYD